MKHYFDRTGTLREKPDIMLEVIRKQNVDYIAKASSMGMGLMVQAMIARSKGNVRICTDMTEDEGIVIDKEKLNI